MAVLPVLVYPDKRLKIPSVPLEQNEPGWEQMISGLTDTFKYAPGCVGISAPQVGWHKRVIIVDASRSSRVSPESGNHGMMVCINPEIVCTSGKLRFREGCLSVPDFTGNVYRSKKITVRYLDRSFNEHIIETQGFEAVIFQHEIDHLDGILFLDRVRSLKRDVFKRQTYLPPNE
ncbi:MAG: peptide deformylase [Candidatus Auribacterota bacterium]